MATPARTATIVGSIVGGVLVDRLRPGNAMIYELMTQAAIQSRNKPANPSALPD